MPDRWSELDLLARLGTRILYETGAVINALAYPAGFYKDPRMPLVYAIRTEGLDL